ncbi:MAG: type II toxin-antitoxin system RelN family antitoxin [Planktothrix sp.]
MKAIETTATINESGQLTLDQSLGITKQQRVRVIVLIPEDDEVDPNETPTEIIIEGIRQGLYEALTGQTIPLSEMWEGIDAE